MTVRMISAKSLSDIHFEETRCLSPTLKNVKKRRDSIRVDNVDLLTSATNESVRMITGFISSSLHKSLDGTKVTMYAQWRSFEDYQNMRNNSVASPYLKKALEIAKFEPGMYEVVETFSSGN